MSNDVAPQKNDRRWACPGFYRMPPSADGGICRIKLDRGRLQLQQLHTLAHAAEVFGNGCIELTTRANVQLRGIGAHNRQKLIDTLTDSGLGPLNPAGDDIRNIMVNPTAGFDRCGHAAIPAVARQLSRILQTTPAYQKLSPKLSFYIDGGEACAVLDHVSDIWLSITRDGTCFAFGVASCPPVDSSQKPALGMVPCAQAIHVITTLLDILIAETRRDPMIQRMKHLLALWGTKRLTDCLREKIPEMLPAPLFRRQVPAARCDLGIHKTRTDGRYYIGLKPPLGRFSPAMLHRLADSVQSILVSPRVHATPWQGLIFADCTREQADNLAAAADKMALVVNNSNAYAHLMCCAGQPGCQAARADVQADARKLARLLPAASLPDINLTACPKSCTATRAKPVTLLALKPGYYDIYLRENTADSKFGRRAASNVAIEDVAAILLA